MNTNDTQGMSINRLGIERSLMTLLEFQECCRMLAATMGDTSCPPSTATELENACKASMIRVLMQEYPEWGTIHDLNHRQIKRFLVNLHRSTSATLAGDFPKIAGTYWDWPPSPEFMDYVDSWIYKYKSDIEERRY